MIYLDHNASAPMRTEVKEALLSAFGQTGNASSVHGYGRAARAVIEGAREEVASLVRVKPAQVVFTGGGTEANNFALAATGRSNIFVSAIEHDAVLAAAPQATRIPVTKQGLVDDAMVGRLLQGQPAALVSVMMVNNETGVIQPIEKIALAAKQAGALMHTDAVQAGGKVAIDFGALGVDMLSLSAHKLGGPQGVGALIVREGIVLQPFMRGGGQEMRRRAGTENVAGIVGFGTAARLAKQDVAEQAKYAAMREVMESRLVKEATDIVIVGQDAQRVSTTSCIAMPRVQSEKQVMAFDLAGIAVSAGAACSSGKVKTSHVLAAMGYAPEIAASAIRVSFGHGTTSAELDRFVDVWMATQAHLTPSSHYLKAA